MSAFFKQCSAPTICLCRLAQALVALCGTQQPSRPAYAQQEPTAEPPDWCTAEMGPPAWLPTAGGWLAV